MKHTRLALASLLFASLALLTPAKAAIDLGSIKPDGFAHGVVFTVAGYTNDTGTSRSTLTDFPVLVRISPSRITDFAYADSLVANGGDLRFKAADGTPLPFEVDTWNTSGESLVWVKLPSMENGTEFAMFYGASATAAGAVAAGNPWGDYTGVWHMRESGSGTSARIQDSTANALTAAGASGSSSVASGKIGGSWRTGNNREKEVALVVDSSTAPNVATAISALGSTFTASFWANPKNSNISWGTYIATKEIEAGDGWGLQWQDNYNGLRVFGGTTRTTTYPTGDDNKTGADGGGRISPTSNFAALRTQNTWHKIDLVFKTGEVDNKTVGMFDVYLDGLLESAGRLRDDLVVSQSVGKLGIGGASAGGSLRRFNGEMDEVRLRAFVPTADWAKADFDTVDDEDFLSASEAEEFTVRPAPVVDAEVIDTGAAFLQFSGTITACGGSATGVDVYVKAWPTANPPVDPDAGWTQLASGVGLNGTFGGFLTGLSPKTEYTWAVKGVNNLSTPEESDLVTDTLETSGVGDAGAGGTAERQLDEFVHTFLVDELGNATFEFTPPDGVTAVDALVVAGGGPGGYYAGGGGGAGGLIYERDLSVTPLSTYTITVGKGGVASDAIETYGTNGENSSIVGTGVNLVAIGGGAGGNGPLSNQTATGAGQDGGSGGGAGGLYTNVGGSGTTDQGNNGGSFADPAVDNKVKDWNNHGPGGGGAGGAGQSLGGNASVKGGGGGGGGIAVEISGASVYYAGGGGGGGATSKNGDLYGTGGAGGAGGGGKGGQFDGTSANAFAENGVDGLGGGGGGGSAYASDYYKGGNGGNGIVIIRYGAGGDGSGVKTPTISLTSLAGHASDNEVEVAFRVGWAGDGYQSVDVYAAYGWQPDELFTTNLVASDKIGQGIGSVALPRVSRTVYVQLIAKNADNFSGSSPEVLSIYLANPAAPIATVSTTEIAITNAGFAATVTALGEGASTVSGVFQLCTDKHFHEGTYTTYPVTNGTLNVAGTLLGAASGLSANTLYWVRVSLTNDVPAGVLETDPIPFRTEPAASPNGQLDPSNENPTILVTTNTISATIFVNEIGTGAQYATASIDISTTTDRQLGDIKEYFNTGIVKTVESDPITENGVSVTLTADGLEPNKEYYIRWHVSNNGGKEIKAIVGPFRTKSDKAGIMFLIY